ncbi:hypothetical protein [Novosphingobium sp.]|uniref:hypothetical protein n=1 Tax=Novosphingobium sp. TaxID=1874826 RepID=UPI0031DE88DE
MTTISSTTGAVGALATYLNQLSAGSTSGSGSDSTASSLISMVQGTDSSSSSNIATLLGTNSSTSGNALSALLGTTYDTTSGLLTEISSLAQSLAATSTAASTSTDTTGASTGTTTGSTSGSDTSTTDTTPTDPAATRAKITKLLSDAFASQQQGFISLLV